MIEEIWKPYPKNPDYLVSSHGRVMGWTNWHKKNRRVLKGKDNGKGYIRIHYQRTPSKQYLVHRMVAETFIPNPKNLPEVNHIDENPQNNHVENLEWVTHWDNMHHGTLPARQRAWCEKMRRMRTREQRQDICVRVTDNRANISTIYPSMMAASRALGAAYNIVGCIMRGKVKPLKHYKIEKVNF